MGTELKADGYYWVKRPNENWNICRVDGQLIYFIGWCVQHQETDWIKKNIEWGDRITEPKVSQDPEQCLESEQSVVGSQDPVVSDFPALDKTEPSPLPLTSECTVESEPEKK